MAVVTTACVLEPSGGGDPLRLDARSRSLRQETSLIIEHSPPRSGEKDLSAVPTLPHFDRLPVPGFPDSVVAAPFQLDQVRPVVVVLHGLGGRPEPHCEAWRNITRARGFVLCPRGAFDPERSTPTDPRYTHPGGVYLVQHVSAALVALGRRYSGLVDLERPLLAGFSLGASEAALLAQGDPARFPRVAVLEGGVDQWVVATIAPFAERGGQRVLFGCGSGWCTPPALAAARRIDGEGVGAEVVFADVGHSCTAPLQDAIKGALDWLLEGDPRWAQD